MLTLKNIKIKNNFAEADFYPENSEHHGHIIINLKDEEIEKIKMVKGYSDMHAAHAIQALIEMAKTNDTRTERLVMWY